jgi:hypothetical protein
MNIPRIVTDAALKQLAAPDETHEVHVIVRRIANQAPYTLRGRRRMYLVTRDQKRNAHVLRVPLSLWMTDVVADKPVAENDSIAYDIQASRTGLKAPLTFEVWPIEGANVSAKPAQHSDSIIDLLETLILRLGSAKNPESYKSLITPDLEKANSRESQRPVLEIFKAAGRTGIIEFIEKMDWNPASESLASPEDQDPLTEAKRAGVNAYLAGKTPAVNPFTADEESELNAAWLEGFETGEAMQPAPKPQAPAPSTEPAPLTNAQRQAAHRARKKAEREAAAKLETAGTP